MTMTREQMLEYITAYESGDPVKDFYTRDQVQKWLYEFCLDGVQMTPESSLMLSQNSVASAEVAKLGDDASAKNITRKITNAIPRSIA